MDRLSARKWGAGVAALLVLGAISPPAATQILITHWRVTVGTTSDATDATGCSLRQAIESVTTNADVGDCQLELRAGNSPDEIQFDPAIVPGQIFLTRQLTVTTDLIINGPGRELFQISGGANVRILDANGADLIVRSITLTRGRALGDGGAIRGNRAVIVEDSRIVNSTAEFMFPRGGCIFISRTGSLALRSTEISGCSALSLGGGIYTEGPFEIENSHLVGNAADRAGGIFAANDGTITTSQIVDNESSVGASVETFNANVSVLASTLVSGVGTSERLVELRGDDATDLSVVRIAQSLIQDDPEAVAGSVISGGNAILNNSLILENSTVTGGRGIASQNLLELLNSTVTTSNTPAVEFSGPSARARFANSIMVSDGADDCDANGVTMIENSHNIYTDGDCTDGQDNVLFVGPMLGPLADNGGATLTRSPLAGSPAIDAGNVFCLSDDQRGFARADGFCDIGAVEVGAIDTLFADGFE